MNGEFCGCALELKLFSDKRGIYTELGDGKQVTNWLGLVTLLWAYCY